MSLPTAAARLMNAFEANDPDRALVTFRDLSTRYPGELDDTYFKIAETSTLKVVNNYSRWDPVSREITRRLVSEESLFAEGFQDAHAMFDFVVTHLGLKLNVKSFKEHVQAALSSSALIMQSLYRPIPEGGACIVLRSREQFVGKLQGDGRDAAAEYLALAFGRQRKQLVPDERKFPASERRAVAQAILGHVRYGGSVQETLEKISAIPRTPKTPVEYA
jgi:hypothetical protein